MKTSYPWEGRVQITVEATGKDPWRLALRLPEWCSLPTLAVNGQPVTLISERGYAVIDRSWQPGDVVVLDLPMVPRLIEANPRLEPARDGVAIERGPIVYCLEQCDQPTGADVLDVEIDVATALTATWHEGLLGGVALVEGQGYAVDMTPWKDRLYRPQGAESERESVHLTAVPYYAWANREPGGMRVWIPRRR